MIDHKCMSFTTLPRRNVFRLSTSLYHLFQSFKQITNTASFITTLLGLYIIGNAFLPLWKCETIRTLHQQKLMAGDVFYQTLFASFRFPDDLDHLVSSSACLASSVAIQLVGPSPSPWSTISLDHHYTGSQEP